MVHVGYLMISKQIKSIHSQTKRVLRGCPLL